VLLPLAIGVREKRFSVVWCSEKCAIGVAGLVLNTCSRLLFEHVEHVRGSRGDDMSEKNKADLRYLLNPSRASSRTEAAGRLTRERRNVLGPVQGLETQPEEKSIQPAERTHEEWAPEPGPSTADAPSTAEGPSDRDKTKKKRGRKPLNLTEEEKSEREHNRKIKKRVRARQWNEEQKRKINLMEEQNNKYQTENEEKRKANERLQEELNRILTELNKFL